MVLFVKLARTALRRAGIDVNRVDMKTKILFSSFLVLVFFLASCEPKTPASVEVPVTQEATAAQPPADISTITPIPTFTMMAPSPTLSYPTASVVKASAVAFISSEGNGYSLRVANVDGSGERKLVDLEKNDKRMNYFFSLQWSPDGKWISYISNDELWIVSPDGLDKRKVLSASNSKRLLFYDWAPDSLRISYTQADLPNIYSYSLSATAKLLNWETGEEYEISSYKISDNAFINWSPNGQYLLFNKGNSFIVFDVSNHKIKKEVLIDKTGCSATDSAAPNSEPVWSPNSEWFFYEISAAAHFTDIYMCISKLDGSTQRVELEGTVYSDVVWDKTGNFLYFIARNIDPNGNPNLDADQRLERYDVRSRKLERLLSLGQKYRSAWSISISPDSRTLETHTEISENQTSYILVDLKSLSVIKKFILEFSCVWLANIENFICLSESNGYSAFYRLGIQTHDAIIFSGEHALISWVVSPIATSP